VTASNVITEPTIQNKKLTLKEKIQKRLNYCMMDLVKGKFVRYYVSLF